MASMIEKAKHIIDKMPLTHESRALIHNHRYIETHRVNEYIETDIQQT